MGVVTLFRMARFRVAGGGTSSASVIAENICSRDCHPEGAAFLEMNLHRITPCI